MKNRIALLAILVLAAAAAFGQERSDYQTVKAFEQKTKDVQVAIDSARTVQECADIFVTLKQIEDEFKADKELLDKALYQEKFDDRLIRLRGHLTLAQTKLGVIESQFVRIAALETQVRELSGRVDSLTGENSRLLSDVERLSGNIKNMGASNASAGALIDSLRRVVGQLQKGLRERDEMIFALVDSMFMQYNKEFSQMGDTEKRGLALRVDRNNVLQAVRTSIANNMRFLENAELKGSDLASLLTEQNRFASQWKGLGPKLAALYISNKTRGKELATVDTMLARWSEKATEAYWRGLAHGFSSHQIDVKPAASGAEFVSNVSNYIDGRMASEGSKDDKAKEFTAFDEVWKAEYAQGWLPLMQSRGDLTPEQVKAVEGKVEDWRSTVTPTSPMTYVVIFIAIVAILVLVYSKMKKKPEAA